jgi:prophage regulatory protein
MSEVLIPYRNLKAKGVPYSKPHLWRLERAGKFPKRVPIGPSRYGYVESEIDAHVAALIAARDAAAAPEMHEMRQSRRRR